MLLLHIIRDILFCFAFSGALQFVEQRLKRK